MRKIRVLVVDDSVVIRRLLTDVIQGDPELEVAATAPNGRIALAKIPQINPDVVTLDIEMPEMDGLETLVELRKTYKRLPVIMFSTLSQRGAVVTLDALSKGADDYSTKPANVGSVNASLQMVRNDLLPKIKIHYQRSLGERSAGRSSAAPPSGPSLRTLAPLVKPRPRLDSLWAPIEVVVIGVSTGGPAALAAVLPALPANFPLPIVVVQHMPPIFTRQLADRLNLHCELHVREAAPGDRLHAGGVWIAPGDFHVAIRRSGDGLALQLNQDPPENSCRPAVDVLFRSAVEACGPHVLGVVMTGMGQDGLRGCQHIREVGGRVLVQDEATSVVWGMPAAVAHAGLADGVEPLERLAPRICDEANRRRHQFAPTAGGLR